MLKMPTSIVPHHQLMPKEMVYIWWLYSIFTLWAILSGMLVIQCFTGTCFTHKTAKIRGQGKPEVSYCSCPFIRCLPFFPLIPCPTPTPFHLCFFLKLDLRLSELLGQSDPSTLVAETRRHVSAFRPPGIFEGVGWDSFSLPGRWWLVRLSTTDTIIVLQWGEEKRGSITWSYHSRKDGKCLESPYTLDNRMNRIS